MDSKTFDGEMLGQRQGAEIGFDRPLTVETRYPHSALPATTAAAKRAASGVSPVPSNSTGRMRAALLIVFAIVALSAFAAIGWMQYQANDGRDDPKIEIGTPDRSVPALADSSGRG